MPKVVKTYGHNEGWSCAFRQHKAQSHCRFIHGYALAIEICFEADDLDECYWVLDFGSLKPLKAYLQKQFDHKLLVAKDDPKLDFFRSLAVLGLADISIVDKVSCEAFAQMVFEATQAHLDLQTVRLVRIVYAKVSEHPGNSAIYP